MVIGIEIGIGKLSSNSGRDNAFIFALVTGMNTSFLLPNSLALVGNQFARRSTLNSKPVDYGAANVTT